MISSTGSNGKCPDLSGVVKFNTRNDKLFSSKTYSLVFLYFLRPLVSLALDHKCVCGSQGQSCRGDLIA